MRCVFTCDTYCCLYTVCPLLSRITQDTIQPNDTASNRATSTPMPAMKVVELLVHAEFDSGIPSSVELQATATEVVTVKFELFAQKGSS